MKIFLLGATGDSGRRILRLALRRAHEVTAFVRDERKLLSLIDRHQTCTCLLRDCADISAESRNGVVSNDPLRGSMKSGRLATSDERGRRGDAGRSANQDR